MRRVVIFLLCAVLVPVLVGCSKTSGLGKKSLTGDDVIPLILRYNTALRERDEKAMAECFAGEAEITYIRGEQKATFTPAAFIKQEITLWKGIEDYQLTADEMETKPADDIYEVDQNLNVRSSSQGFRSEITYKNHFVVLRIKGEPKILYLEVKAIVNTKRL